MGFRRIAALGGGGMRRTDALMLPPLLPNAIERPIDTKSLKIRLGIGGPVHLYGRNDPTLGRNIGSHYREQSIKVRRVFQYDHVLSSRTTMCFRIRWVVTQLYTRV